MLPHTDKQTVEEMLVTPDMLADQYSAHNNPVSKDLVSYFVSGVVGIRLFDQNKCHIKYMRYTTILSDETFTVLMLDWNRWSSMAKANEWRDSNEPSKWTTSKFKRKVCSQQGKSG
jgi:hypothetical protein